MDKQEEMQKELYKLIGEVFINLEKIDDLIETKDYAKAKEMVKQLRFKYYRIMCF